MMGLLSKLILKPEGHVVVKKASQDWNTTHRKQPSWWTHLLQRDRNQGLVETDVAVVTC